jgi:hypothetical protein
MNVDEQGGFDGQGNERDRRAARTELRLGDADGEHELRRGSTNGGDGSNGEEREREWWWRARVGRRREELGVQFIEDGREGERVGPCHAIDAIQGAWMEGERRGNGSNELQ